MRRQVINFLRKLVTNYNWNCADAQAGHYIIRETLIMKNIKFKQLWKDGLPAIYFPALLFYLECIFRIFVIRTAPSATFILTFFMCITAGAVLGIVCGLFKPRINRILSVIFSVLAVLIFAVQTVYMGVFQTPLVLFGVGGAGQVLQFMDIIVSTIISRLLPLLLMIAAPVAAQLAMVHFHIEFRKYPPKVLPFFAVPVFVPMLIIFISLTLGGKSAGSAYSVYYYERPGTLVLNRFGLLACTKNDIKSLIFPESASLVSYSMSSLQETLDEREEDTAATNGTGSAMANKDTGNVGSGTLDTPSETVVETEAPVIIEPNVMDIDFNALAQSETDANYKAMNEYFSSVNPTYTNEYTGMFEGYNLIFLTAESFSPYVIDPELTPTLYKLANEGFVFNNFYNPVWGVSTSDGEYVNCQSLIPKSGVWSMAKSGKNWLPFTMGNQFWPLGYKTLAYHNHSYDYYDRDISHPNLGYTYKGYGSGLDVTYVWPESDLEMMELTIPEYINEDHFSIYYMTVSGHMPYSWGGNAMATKHKDAVADLPYSDNVKGYLACHMELDKALEYLLDELEKAGKLDNTVIVMGADHYPYGLESSELAELAGHEVEKNFELYKSSLILWNAGMADEPVQVDKYCSSMDILPTISNLFGLEYDSRLLIGRDILSDSTPLVIFSNKSWITNKAFYNSQTGEVTPVKEGDTVSDAYVQAIHQQVADKFTFSRYILDYNYYEYLFGRPENPAETEDDTVGESETVSDTQADEHDAGTGGSASATKSK